MRVALNDYAGHPFQIQLARALAERGHEVTFLYCSTNVTPHGDLTSGLAGLEVVGVSTGATFAKYTLVKRAFQEIRYGVASARVHRQRRCDVVLSSNVPVLALLVLRLLAPSTRHVLWLQDVQAGLARLALRGPRRWLAGIFARLERLAIELADAVVVIAPSMADHLASEGVDQTKTIVIENWAPIDELPDRPKVNDWSAGQGLDESFVFLYTGTLGIKHRPELLVQLCRRFRDESDVRVVVVSEGRGAEWLAAERDRQGLDNLVLLPFQPFADLPDTLATADVLLAVLEQEAGSFSIPSKVLSYLCAGRPILASLPAANSSSDLIANRAGGGLVSTTDDDFVSQAELLFGSSELRSQLGDRGRRYAEKAFDIDQITGRFLEILGEPADTEQLVPVAQGASTWRR